MFLVLIIVHSLIRNISLQPIRDHSELDRRVNVSTCTFVPLNQLNLELPREKNTIIVTLTSRCRLGTPFVSGFEPVKQVIWYHFPRICILFSSRCHNGIFLDPSVLVFSLSLYRHPIICILFNSRFTS